MNNTVIKTIEILKLVAAHPQGLTLAQIVSALDYPKSTVFNIVRTLESQEMLSMSGEVQPVYRLGIGALKIGVSYLNGTSLHAAARPVLSELCRETNETVFMSVRSGRRDLVYIMKYLSDAEFQTVCSIGTVRPLLSVAMGKAMLTAMPDEEIRAIMTPEAFAASSLSTITDLSSLMDFVRAARKTGYVVEATSENPHFASSVAAPVLDVNHTLAGAISIVAMHDPSDPDRIAALGKRVNAAALEISRGLGYLGDTLFRAKRWEE